MNPKATNREVLEEFAREHGLTDPEEIEDFVKNYAMGTFSCC